MTNKKNTLLYLDKDLVDESKRAGLNLSLVMEEALRSRLPYYDKFIPENYLMRALREGTAAILPLQIEDISFTKMRGIGDKTFKLRDLNMIVGANGTGKSTIFRLLRQTFRISQLNEVGDYPHMETNVTVTIAPTQKIEYREKKGDYYVALDKQCLVTDGLFARLAEETRLKMVKYLVKSGAQLILLETQILPGTEKFNIIEL